MEDRAASLTHISEALERIKASIEKIIKGVRVLHRKEVAKLQVLAGGVDIKLEVNLVGRGLINSPLQMPLCQKAQDEFDAFCSMPIVPIGQLYSGKICSALDRQHPRDLFNIKYFLEDKKYFDTIKKGFLYCLFGSDQPINEVIGPNF